MHSQVKLAQYLLKNGANASIKSCRDERPAGKGQQVDKMFSRLWCCVTIYSDLCESEQLAETLQNAAKEAELHKQRVEEERKQEEAIAPPPPALLSPDADTGWEEFARPRANSRSLSLYVNSICLYIATLNNL